MRKISRKERSGKLSFSTSGNDPDVTMPLRDV